MPFEKLMLVIPGSITLGNLVILMLSPMYVINVP